MELISVDRLVRAGRMMEDVAAVQPKRVDFKNPFYTQPRDAKNGTSVDVGVDVLEELHGTQVQHVYLHVPFCATRCTYCHYPIVQPGAEPEGAHDRFVDTLVEEIGWWRRSGLDFSRLKTIAIGGGTPNVLTHRHFERVLHALGEHFPIRSEVSIEVLPSKRLLDQKMYELFRSAGVNRLSVGIQTFNDAINDANRRTYQRADETIELVDLAKSYFPNVSVDLLYRQRKQEWADLVADIAAVKRLDVNSVYLYQVREHIGTEFVELQRALNYFLAEMTNDGQYECVSFDQVIKRRNDDGLCRAREGRSQCENLLGIGPAAVSELGDFTFRNVDPDAYLAEGRNIERQSIVRRDRAWLEAEWISRGFRHFNVEKLDGISFPMFEARFGNRPNGPLVEKLRYLEQTGLIELRPDAALLTPTGMLFTQAISGFLIGHYK